jgi:histidinol phosphatase-like PHP family hydrolase
MKNWMKYETYLMDGEWHIHTDYTDGENSVDEYCREAIKKHIPLLAFTEHVRRKLTYSFHDLMEEIESARTSYRDLKILSGCEAKVLDDGELDVSEDTLRKCDIVLMAFHSFPNDKSKYVHALKKALSNLKVDVWAHPGTLRFQNDLSLTDKEVADILNLAKKKEVLVEINRKYNMPPSKWLEIGSEQGLKFVRGNDVHSIRDLK